MDIIKSKIRRIINFAKNEGKFERADLVKVLKNTSGFKIYDKYIVDPTDVSCTSQNTGGKKEITLITCTDDSKQRVIVKARAI